MQFKKFINLLILSTFILSSFLSVLTWNVTAMPAPTLALSKTSGKVGEVISVNGTIDTENGPYEIRFNGIVMKTGNATGNEVICNFTVPNFPAGQYNVTIYDVNATLESEPVQFIIETDYILEIVNRPEEPSQFLEGANVTISVKITGGNESAVYNLNITVTIYDMVSYNLTTLETDENGAATKNVTYPIDFLPLNFTGKASTNYTGTYIVKLNETLATPANFTVGITDRTEYHRGDLLIIHAAGYQANETATINIRFPNKDEPIKINVNASSSGIIHVENQTILENVPMGDYQIWINGTQTMKEPPDIQKFIVPGYPVIIPVRNLRGDPISEVTLEIFENETEIGQVETAENGNATVKLEKGNYAWRAIYKEKLVGEGNLTTHGIANETEILPPLNVSLSVLDITITDERTGKTVPFVFIEISCNYTTVDGENRSLTLTGEAGIEGSLEFVNLFVNETYIIEAYKYNALFNRTILSNLPEEPVLSINITYPAKTLVVKVVDYLGKSVEGIIVKGYELTNGTAVPTDEGESDVDGTVTLHLSFGLYRLRVFKPIETGLILINETQADLTVQNETVEMNILCKLLELNVTIKVVDFLGSPIPNTVVRLESTSANLSYYKTGEGEFLFEHLIGGRYRILVFLPSSSETPYLMAVHNIDKSGIVITLRDGDHVCFFGTLIGTYTFILLVIIAVAAVIALLILVYKRVSGKWIEKEKV